MRAVDEALQRAVPLALERLAGYAPDLNPVEMLWGNIKGQELANRCAEDLDEAVTALTYQRHGSSPPTSQASICFPATRWSFF